MKDASDAAPLGRLGARGDGDRTTPPSTRLDRRVERLIRNPKPPGALKLWNAFTHRERERAVHAMLRRDPKMRRALDRIVAEARHFRPTTVRKWSVDKIAKAMTTVSPGGRALASSLVRSYFMRDHRGMVLTFLDTAGIPHKEGWFDDDLDHEPSGEEVQAGADAIAASYSDRAVALYLFLLATESELPALNRGAQAWLRERRGARTGPKGVEDPRPRASRATATAEEGNERSDAANEPPAAADEPALAASDAALDPSGDSEDEVDDEPRARILTTLDHLLIQSAKDTVQEVRGALTEDQLDDAVHELVKLNGKRPQSHFHAGFVEGLLDRPISDDPALGDPIRQRWFWAGVVRGWAENQRWTCIVDQYRENAVVRDLGDGRDSASLTVVCDIVDALREADECGEIAKFVKKEALLGLARLARLDERRERRDLYRLLLEIATRSLRGGDAESAKPVFELLTRAERELDEQGEELEVETILETHRRKAHCLRKLGEHARAETLLEALLEEDPNPNVHAMARADLGLIQGSFDELDEVALPRRRSELGGFLERLERGAEDFRGSDEADTEYSAHGRYCLGVLALGRAVEPRPGDDETPFADPRLEEAVAHLQGVRGYFSKRGDEYAEDLVHRASLYFGIAKALRLEKLSHAADVVQEALERGARFPPYLIGPTLEALDEGDDEGRLRNVAKAILNTAGAAGLDELVQSEVALKHCPELSDSLFERSGRSDRNTESRARDARAALRGFLRRRDNERASDALDLLEGFAQEGAGVEEFLELLDDDRRYDPAWKAEDAAIARAHCLEAHGRHHDALYALRKLFFKFVASRSDEGRDSAVDILRRVERYPIAAADYEDLTKQHDKLEKERRAERAALADRDPGPRLLVKVLVVGGAERQSKSQDAVRKRLRERDRQVEIEFVPTGWNSDWRRTLPEVEARMDDSHGLVILRFMRTACGRTIRKRWPGDKPWRSCWSGSSGSISETVLKVADLARAQS